MRIAFRGFPLYTVNMTYALTILRDKPRGLWLLDDGSLVDSSDQAGDATPNAAMTKSSAALVSGLKEATYTGNGTFLTFPARIYKPGYEATAFSLEAWIFPSTGTQDLVSRYDHEDGISIVDGEVRFSIRFTGSTAMIAYKPDNQKTLHVVGVYTPTGITLYINGALFKQKDFNEAQRADTFALADYNETFWSGTVTSNVTMLQAVAVYEYALNKNQVAQHYKVGRDAVDPDNVPSIYGGRHLDLTDIYSDVFLREQLGPVMSWNLGNMDTLSTNSKGQLVQQYSDGVYVEGAWTYSFNTGYAEGAIQGVRLSWEGEGDFTVETSVDATTWEVANNDYLVPSITAGETHNQLFIRITFPEDDGGFIDNLEVIGYRTNTIDVPNRAIVATAPVCFREEFDPLIKSVATGTDLHGGTLTIPPSTEDSAPGDYTWEYWYYTPDGTIGIDPGMAGTVYQNGAAFTAVRTGTWNLIHIVSSGSPSSGLAITGNIIIGRAASYPAALTATQVANIYKQYTGKLQIPITGDGTVGVLTPSVKIYASDWAVSAAG